MNLVYVKVVAKYRKEFGEIGKIVEKDSSNRVEVRLANGEIESFSDKEVKGFNPFVPTKRQPLCNDLLAILQLPNPSENSTIRDIQNQAYAELLRQFSVDSFNFQVMLYRSGMTLSTFETIRRRHA